MKSNLIFKKLKKKMRTLFNIRSINQNNIKFYFYYLLLYLDIIYYKIYHNIYNNICHIVYDNIYCNIICQIFQLSDSTCREI